MLIDIDFLGNKNFLLLYFIPIFPLRLALLIFLLQYFILIKVLWNKGKNRGIEKWWTKARN